MNINSDDDDQNNDKTATIYEKDTPILALCLALHFQLITLHYRHSYKKIHKHFKYTLEKKKRKKKIKRSSTSGLMKFLYSPVAADVRAVPSF